VPGSFASKEGFDEPLAASQRLTQSQDFRAVAIIDFASTGILPTRRNSISVDPATASNVQRVNRPELDMSSHP
jgi:hypothetical protein